MSEEDKASLAEILTTYMEASGIGDAKLANLVNRVVEDDLLNRSSVRNWREGTSRKIRSWQQLVAIAFVLKLDKSDLNQLLEISELPSIEKLSEQSEGVFREICAEWLQESGHLSTLQTSSLLSEKRKIIILVIIGLFIIVAVLTGLLKRDAALNYCKPAAWQTYCYSLNNQLSGVHTEEFIPNRAGFHEIDIKVPNNSSVTLTLCWKRRGQANEEYNCWLSGETLGHHPSWYTFILKTGESDIIYRVSFSNVIANSSILYRYKLDYSDKINN